MPATTTCTPNRVAAKSLFFLRVSSMSWAACVFFAASAFSAAAVAAFARNVSTCEGKCHIVGSCAPCFTLATYGFEQRVLATNPIDAAQAVHYLGFQ